MAMNALQGLVACLEAGEGAARSAYEVHVPEPVRSQALGCIDRMLDFVRRHPASVAQPAQRRAAGTASLVPGIGAA
jgi:quinolinate synthase